MSSRTVQQQFPGLDDEPAACETPEQANSQPPCQPGEPVNPDEQLLASPPSLAGKNVWVVDANSLIFQVFHAIPEMTSPQGEPVNAVFGFTRDMLYLLEKKRPDYLLCALDPSGPTFRNELFAAYKANRSECPPELVPQQPKIRLVLEALGIPAVCVSGFEADDLLATIARRTEELGGDCVVVTGDKDCRQLISDHVKIYNVRKDQLYDAAALAADWGVKPEQVVDFQALVGDPVDNVPGIPLIGPKLARDLLVKYGTLEEVLAHANELSGERRRQNLIEGRESVLVSRKLVRLDNDVPMTIPWQAAKVGPVNPSAMLALCGQFGFHRFAEQFRGAQAAAPVVQPAIKSHVIDTPEKFADFLVELKKQPVFSFDLETTSIAPTQAEIVGYSLSWQAGEGYYLPVRAPAGEAHLDPAATLEALRSVLESPEVGKIGQNLKYDALVLRACGVALAGIRFDTMMASYLLDAGERNHNLDELAKRYLDHTTIKISQLIGTGKNQKCMDEVPVAQVADYAVEDAEVAWRLWPILERRLAEDKLTELFEQLELPLVDVLVELEHNGIRIDADRLQVLSTQYGQKISGLETEIYQMAGHPFNIASPKQLQQVLFVEQGLPVQARTKTGPSTDASVLEELALAHPLPAKIIEYRQFAKLKNTYVDALPCMVNPRTGRVHCSFHQAVTATGRLSSSDPNLQNIPIRSESGREIRSAFLPAEPGWRLLAADYSQIELRVLAHFCQDSALCEAFARDEDIHAMVASQVYGVPLADVDSTMRRAAKAVNFGIIYGQSAFGLAKSLGIEQEQAAAFIDAYFQRYPGVEQFLAKILEDCLANGYVSTVLGRRRAIRGIRPGAGRQRNLPERTAINTVIQGSAADLIKQAMIAIHRRLRREGLPAKMLLQIHDELVFEAPAEQIDALAQLVVHEMTSVMPLRVPLKVDVKTGQSWADTEAWN
ncbi:MAG TPA: DNA polymerase I [Pirellulales bacterium]|jgi:DNA polymerase-1|nr:DNA polymerase I [Pirellulales bacterium]